MADFTVKFEPGYTPGLERVTFRTSKGYLVGNVGPSATIASSFGPTPNPARYKFLKSLDAPVAWLDRINVNKEFRGVGYGTHLMKQALQVLGESGVRYVVLSPQAEHVDYRERLDQFYKRLGFVDVREFEGEQLWNRLMMLDLAT